MKKRTTRLDEPDPSGGYSEVSEYPDGRRVYTRDGDFHRTDGPAFVGVDGRQTWHLHGREHRLDGPAVTYPDGHAEYWIEGVHLSEEEFQARTAAPR